MNIDKMILDLDLILSMIMCKKYAGIRPKIFISTSMSTLPVVIKKSPTPKFTCT